MRIHKPYQERSNQAEDFRVKYSFIRKDDGSYIQKPFQEMRCDFSYDGDNIEETGIYMIWPEFEDAEGDVIKDTGSLIDNIGTAKMWILVPEMREEVHKGKAKVGAKGFFMVGKKKIAKAEVIELVGLHTNAN